MGVASGCIAFFMRLHNFSIHFDVTADASSCPVYSVVRLSTSFHFQAAQCSPPGLRRGAQAPLV